MGLCEVREIRCGEGINEVCRRIFIQNYGTGQWGCRIFFLFYCEGEIFWRFYINFGEFFEFFWLFCIGLCGWG